MYFKKVKMGIINTVKYYFGRVYKKIFPGPSKDELIEKYISLGRIPWSEGYIQYKMDFIERTLGEENTIQNFTSSVLPKGFAIGIDERAVEYPWIFSNLSKNKTKILDAGSTFNYPEVINQQILKEKELTITTYFPEGNNFNNKRVSYVYADLRKLPFRDEWFDEIVCQSTLEHIDMDNSMYGYELKNIASGQQKSYEYMKVVSELCRILKSNGMLLLTFPFGKFENHGFFQQFDNEMIIRIKQFLGSKGGVETAFFQYLSDGWVFSSEEECKNALSYNPHTGMGKGDDGAAHSRAICCLKFIKGQ